MAQSLEKKEALLERRAQVARLLLARTSQVNIAKVLGVDRMTIVRDVKMLQDEWRKKLVDDPVALKAQELAELREMERETVTRYVSSHAGGEIDRRLKIKERIAKMLGLDAPQEISGPGGGPIQFDDAGLRAKLERMLGTMEIVEGQVTGVNDG